MQTPPRRILCAENNDDTCFLLATLLERENYEVKTAISVSDTLWRAKTEHFDLYILDNEFPDGTGIELCKRLREFDTTTPIIFFADEVSSRRQAMDAGAQAYLVKPEIAGIVEIIGWCLSDKEFKYM